MNQSEPRINQYTCRTCGKYIVTIDRDVGVTPAMLNCRATHGCSGIMDSARYRVRPGLKLNYEWYKPENLDGFDRDMREHIEMGGLVIRKIEDQL